jgi:hypothetical protein
VTLSFSEDAKRGFYFRSFCFRVAFLGLAGPLLLEPFGLGTAFSVRPFSAVRFPSLSARTVAVAAGAPFSEPWKVSVEFVIRLLLVVLLLNC